MKHILLPRIIVSAFFFFILIFQSNVSGAQTCGNPVNVPVTLGGVNVSGAGTGSVGIYATAYNTCGFGMTPANTLYIGQSGAFTYTYTFSQPLNNVVIMITATGGNMNEIFTITTNGPGIPVVTSGNMCYTTIAGNVISSGAGAPAPIGGGGLFNVYNAGGAYTTLTISGPGGDNGSLMALCSYTILNQNPCNLAWDNVSHTDIGCMGGATGSINATTLNAAPPLSFNLQPGNITNASGIFSNLGAGTYTVTATDANCSISTTVVITAVGAVQFNTVNLVQPSCTPGCDGSATTSTSGGNPPYLYSISGGASIDASGNAGNLCGGTVYTLTATDANSCSATTTVQLLALNAPAINLVSQTNVSCSGTCDGTAVFNSAGGNPPYSYSITPLATQGLAGSFNTMCGGTYTVTVNDATGCSNSMTVVIASPPPNMQFTTVDVHEVYCNGDASGSIAVVVNGGNSNAQFSITPNATQLPLGFFKDLTAGSYTITATDLNGCTASTVATVNEHPAIQIHSIEMQSPVCSYDSNGSISYVGSGGAPPLLYSLNDGTVQPTGVFPSLKSGWYKLKVIDNLGCSKDTLIELAGTVPVGALLDIHHAHCVNSEDGRVFVQGTGGHGGYKYFITPGLHINKSGDFYSLAPNTYTLRVVDTLGCEYSTLFSIDPPQDPLVNVISKTDLACHGKGNEGKATANVSGGKAPYVFEWSTTPVQNTPTAHSLYFGMYHVLVTDANGCKLQDSVYINEGPCCDVTFIPNAFSPNGDGLNDEFRILSTAGIIPVQLEVYDRWGQKVWNSSNYRRGWDGLIEGKEAEAGTYYYIFRYNCTLDDKTYLKKGDVILVR